MAVGGSISDTKNGRPMPSRTVASFASTSDATNQRALSRYSCCRSVYIFTTSVSETMVVVVNVVVVPLIRDTCGAVPLPSRKNSTSSSAPSDAPPRVVRNVIRLTAVSASRVVPTAHLAIACQARSGTCAQVGSTGGIVASSTIEDVTAVPVGMLCSCAVIT